MALFSVIQTVLNLTLRHFVLAFTVKNITDKPENIIKKINKCDMKEIKEII